MQAKGRGVVNSLESLSLFWFSFELLMVQQQQQQVLFFLFVSFVSIFTYTHTHSARLCCCPPFDGQCTHKTKKKRRRRRSQENARTRRDYKHAVSDQTTGTRAPATTATLPARHRPSFSSSSSRGLCYKQSFLKIRGGGG